MAQQERSQRKTDGDYEGSGLVLLMQWLRMGVVQLPAGIPGRTEIAESLSKIALADIVVVVLTYAGKALVEQLSKYNKWPDKPTKKEEDNV